MSSAISRFTTALLAGSQENTLALAALNFDFSLYKVEAPSEYHVLGSCLTEERRQVAENGSHHITARKLGAIFRSKLPRVPHLIKAYGQRVSEVAKSAAETESIKNFSNSSVLGGKVGVDGTSIWAAATSGPEAICVQLLACILARFWAPQEATSIWAEILEERKQELSERDGDFDFPELAAMQANVTREQLAEWDASARAWLRVADKHMAKQQTQLRLIINNINVEVNTKRGTYDSVMDAWTTSMEVVNNLISGVPQRIHDGAALVGLASWHLYPNMVVFEKSSQDVIQNDPLLQDGGFLTIGLQASVDFDKGICWSLPLAKLRYYGDPVVVSKSLNSSNSRIPFDQLWLVVLGCLARKWPTTEMSDDYWTICTYYSLLWNHLKSGFEGSDAEPWMQMLGNAATVYLDASGNEKPALKRLIEFGFRSCDRFLGLSGELNYDTQMFNMTSFEGFLGARKPEAQIEYIRECASDLGVKSSADWLITQQHDHRHGWSWATILPARDQTTHFRWYEKREWATKDKQLPHQDKVLAKGNWEIEFIRDEENDPDRPRTLRFFQREETAASSQSKGKTRDHFKDVFLGIAIDMEVYFDLYLGNPEAGGTALWRKSSARHILNTTNNRGHPQIPALEIMDSLESNKLSLRHVTLSEQWAPLMALAAAGNIYKSLTAATITLEMTAIPLKSAFWCNSLGHSIQARQLSQQLLPPLPNQTALACIALLETGDQNLEPRLLKNVMAMSVGDSIYASPALISDPHSDTKANGLVRTLGNIGKPGISLLIPPPSPRVRKLKRDEWNVITHDAWDGQAQDSFGETSLHLLLTEYRVPYASEHAGSRDIQAFFQEAVVSIYDRETWIGDVDILKAIESPSLSFVKSSAMCPHGDWKKSKEEEWGAISASEKRSKERRNLAMRRLQARTYAKQDEPQAKEKGRIRCIDNWSELLDKPPGTTIVRSRGNWIGRLATASLSSQLGYRTTILPTKECTDGCFSNLEFMAQCVASEGDVIIM